MLLPEAIVIEGLHVAMSPHGRHKHDGRVTAYRLAAALGASPARIALYHTAWGQPRFRRKPDAGEYADPMPAVSFTHDGPVRIAAVARDRRCLGLGVDVVRLGRFRGDGSLRRAERLAMRLLSPEERADLADCPGCLAGAWQELACRFSLKEAISKALGTGLNLGLGMGYAHGLPPQAIQVGADPGDPRIHLSAPAAARMRELGADSVHVRWWLDQIHLVSVAVLTRTKRRNPALPRVVDDVSWVCRLHCRGSVRNPT